MLHPTQMTDRETLFTSLLSRHRPMLWRMCWRRSGRDTECCKDLMQEVSIDLWNHLDKLRPEASPQQERAWVGWRARSTFFRIGRSKRPPTEPLTDHIANSLKDDSQSHANIIDSYIASLSDNDQQLMQLYLEGYNADEIGQKIGTSRDAVYQRMHRAIKKMRYTVLILVLLITAGATAIAVVPQWDIIFSNKWGGLWHGNEDKDEDEDEKACGTKTNTKTTLDENDDKNENEPPTSVTNAKITSIERLPVIDISQLLPSSDTIYVPAADSKLALSINGDNIIITGKTGETVRIYDMSGNLVASGVADGLCILDPFPKHSLVLHLTDYYFRLQIGNREEILLVL